MTWGYGMCFSPRCHKGADVLGILIMYHEMTQLGPHSLFMSRIRGGIFQCTWKIEWVKVRKPPLEESQVEFDVQPWGFAVLLWYRAVTVPTLGSQLSGFTSWPVKAHKLHWPWLYDDSLKKYTNQTYENWTALAITKRDIWIRHTEGAESEQTVTKMEHEQNTQNKLSRNNWMNIQIWLRATIATLSLLSLSTQEKSKESGTLEQRLSRAAGSLRLRNEMNWMKC